MLRVGSMFVIAINSIFTKFEYFYGNLSVSNRIENPGLDAPDHLKEYIEIAETETNFT